MTRIKLAVTVNLDPMPGVFHTANSAEGVIKRMLINNMGHYNPDVVLVDDGEGIFHHECEDQLCGHNVIFDDEPYCFSHSPDVGSSVRGYSARANAERRQQ